MLGRVRRLIEAVDGGAVVHFTFMRKRMHRSIALGTVLALLAVSSASFAQESTTAVSASATTTEPTTSAGSDDGKKMGIGGDLQFVLPLGDFADASGPQIGPLFRFGYRVMPALEVTARVGYLYGLSKDNSGFKTSVSNIPVWVGARYFFMEPGAGLYGAGELGLNNMTFKIDGTLLGQSVESSDSNTRFGFNVGAGYVISKELPIDIRAQFMHHNLLGTEEGEKAILGLGISAGYTASF